MKRLLRLLFIPVVVTELIALSSWASALSSQTLFVKGRRPRVQRVRRPRIKTRQRFKSSAPRRVRPARRVSRPRRTRQKFRKVRQRRSQGRIRKQRLHSPKRFKQSKRFSINKQQSARRQKRIKAGKKRRSSLQKKERARFKRERRKGRQERKHARKIQRQKVRQQASRAREQRRTKINAIRQERLHNRQHRVASYTGFSVGVTGGAGAGIVVGTTTVAFMQHRNVAFWGPHFYYGYVGCWHYPNFGCWYHPHFSCWYYPWNHCWYYPHHCCWHYPVFGVTVYLEPKTKHYLIVENERDEEAYFAVYYREPVDGGYYLYGVGSPKKVFEKEVVKVTLPPGGSSKDYMVIVNRDKKVFKRRLIQDSRGDILHEKSFEQEPAYTVDEDQLTTQQPSRSEKRDFDWVKGKVQESRPELEKVEGSIKQGTVGKKTDET